jgi:zinc D-Ala-D-Ala carboxypeptidase
MGDLSKNFNRSEFACKCCGVVRIRPSVVEGVQQIRDLAGVPVHINSGYRCIPHNKAEGGAKRSQHLLGAAADIVVEGMTPMQMYLLALEVPQFKNGGIGVSDTHFIHVDDRGYRKRWGYLNGKEVSWDEFQDWLQGETA